jgi:putative oxidoreductase
LISNITRLYRSLSGVVPEAIMLLFVRLAFAGIFWRSGQAKLEDGTWRISEGTYGLFETEYAGVPLPPHLAAMIATLAEHIFPVLLMIGLASRPSALALLGMTLVIQFFVYPEAWWTVHIIWVALALVIVVRGPGLFSVDSLVVRGATVRSRVQPVLA